MQDHPKIPPQLQAEAQIERKDTTRYLSNLRAIKSLKRKIWASAELWTRDNDIARGTSSNDLLFDYFSESKFNYDILEGNSFTEHHNPLGLEKGKNTLAGALEILGIPPDRAKTMSGKDLDNWLSVEKQTFEDEPQTRRLKNYLDYQFRKAQQQTRKSMWSWRIAQEAEERDSEDWYPFFVTLTVDPKIYPDRRDFWRKPHLKVFIRKLVNIACVSCGDKQPRYTGAKAEDYLVWVGQLEHGKSGHHHHMHIMMWLKDIPESWKQCPNKGLMPKYRTLRRCKEIESLWPWANQKEAVYWRHADDIWSRKHKFIFPMKVNKEGNPVDSEIGSVRQAGAYLVKYMTKGEKQDLHRIRGTRGLGLRRLRKLIEEADQEKLTQLAVRPPEFDTIVNAQSKTSVPLGFVRQLAKKERDHRQVINGIFDPIAYLEKSVQHHRKIMEKTFSGMRLGRLSKKEMHEMFTEVLGQDENWIGEDRYMDAVSVLGESFPVEPQGSKLLIPGIER